MATTSRGAEVGKPTAKRRKLDLGLKISESDITDITKIAKLQHNQLQHLFRELGIETTDIENAERMADTRDFKLQSIRVLQFWLTTNGQRATRKAVIKALEECGFIEAREILLQKWSCDYPVNTAPKFNLAECKEELIEFYRQEMGRVQLLPWCDDSKDMDDIYVTLKLQKESTKGTELLSNNEDIVSLRMSQGIPATRILVKGVAGSGKSTLLAKLAYSWSKQTSDSPLARFQLLFILTLREVKHDSLIDILFEQIFETNTRVSKDGLQIYIDSNPHAVLLLLDGFDEYSGRDLSTPTGSLQDIITFRALRKCCTIISSRPYQDLQRYQSNYLIVKVSGFSRKNVELYMEKFFIENRLVCGLQERIEESDRLASLSKTPVMLMLMCLLWEDDQKLPDTQSELYEEFVHFLWRKYCKTQGKDVDFENKIVEGEFSQFISALGCVALDGLCSEHNIKEEKIVFKESDFVDSMFQLGCETGLLTRERLRSKLSRRSAVQFLHKSFQEFCAAKIWANMYASDRGQFSRILSRLKSWQDLMNKFNLFKFCCSIVESSGLNLIIEHVIGMYTKYSSPKEVCIGYNRPENSKKNIVNILILLNEGQNGESADERCQVEPQIRQQSQDVGCSSGSPTSTVSISNSPLIQSFKSILPDEGLTIDVSNKYPKSIEIFHNFVKTKLGFSVLSTIKSISFVNPHLSHNVIGDTFQCLSTVESLTIRRREAPSIQGPSKLRFDNLSLHTMTKLCKLEVEDYTHVTIAHSQFPAIVLKQLAILSNRYISLYLNDITVFLGHVDASADVKPDNYKACSNLRMLNLSNIQIKECVGDTSQTNSIQSLALLSFPGKKMGSVDSNKLTTAGGKFCLKLRGCKVSDVVARKLFCHIINPHIQVIDVCNAQLKEGQIKILSEFLPIASNLQKLDLSENTIGMSIKPLAQQLQHCTKLLVLNLSDTQLKECEIEVLVEFLPTVLCLQVLDLSYNMVGKAIVHIVQKAVKHCPKLNMLNLSHMQMSEHVLPTNDIGHLSLQSFTDKQLQSRGTHEQTIMPRIFCLKLRGCKVSEAVTRKLFCHIINPHIHIIDFRNAQLKEKHIKILSALLPNASNLQELDLSYNIVGTTTQSIIENAFKCCPKFTKLNLSHIKMAENTPRTFIIKHLSLQCIAEKQPDLININKPAINICLKLRGCRVPDVITRQLFPQILNPYIKVIDFCHAQLKEKHIKALSEFLPWAVNLQTLNLSYNTVGMAIEQIIQKALRYCHELAMLNLSHIQMLPGNIEQLSLQKTTGSEPVDIDYHKQTVMLRTFCLKLRGCKVPDVTKLALFCHIINPHIQVIDFRKAQLNYDHIDSMSKCLSKASSLQELDLSNNAVGMAIELLAHQLHYCTSLLKLKLSNTQLEEDHILTLSEFLPKASNLQELDLSYNTIGVALRYLVHQLYCTRLSTLKLSDTQLKEDHVKELSKFHLGSSNLKELDLSQNPVGMAIEPLSQTLQCCTVLSKLDLSGTDITEQGVTALAQRFVSIPNLTRLDLYYNLIGNAGVDALFSHIHHLTKIEYLRISPNLDNQCSALVKECLAAIGRTVTITYIKMDHADCQTVQNIDNKYQQ